MESVYSVTQWFSHGRRQLKSKEEKRAPGSVLDCFCCGVTAVVLKKLRRKLLMLIPSCPLPPQITERSNPNSTLGVGLKLIFSTCNHGSFGSECPFRLPTKKSYRNVPVRRESSGI